MEMLLVFIGFSFIFLSPAVAIWLVFKNEYKSLEKEKQDEK